MTLTMLPLFSLLVLPFLVSSTIIHLPATSIVMYWGQDSAADNAPSLLTFCQQGQYDVINLAFMISFVDTRQPSCAVPNAPDLNFANHGNDCDTWPNCPFLLNCSQTIGEDIVQCQKMGKKIVLSLGGAVGSYGFTSDQEAVGFAGTLWDMFFEGNSTLRPFGNAILDGIDLDIEGGSTVGYSTFVKTIRTQFAASGKGYIISGAPQCPYPDAYLGPSPGTPLGDVGSDFSYISVQFYNNYCGLSSSNDFWTSFGQWHTSAVARGYKVLVGLPSAPSAGGGWVSVDLVCAVVPKLQTYSNFGGFMFWDASWDQKNGWYAERIKKCL